MPISIRIFFRFLFLNYSVRIHQHPIKLISLLVANMYTCKCLLIFFYFSFTSLALFTNYNSHIASIMHALHGTDLEFLSRQCVTLTFTDSFTSLRIYVYIFVMCANRFLFFFSFLSCVQHALA